MNKHLIYSYTDKNLHEQQNFYNHVDGQMLTLTTDSSEISNDVKFSVYCFCDGTGEAVLCAIILLSDKEIADIPYSIRYGIDVCKTLNEGHSEEELYQRNCRSGQAMQGGPEITYRGKLIQSFVGTSRTGRLDSDVLLKICQYLDSFELYDRSNGVKPFLLLDGHGTVFETTLLDYIREPEHEWVINCGIHHDAHLLQLANSFEFNKTFKDEFELSKERLLDMRSRSLRQRLLFPSDIMPLVCNAWMSSFGLPSSCKKPMSLRGWNPLNYALLLHPILNKKEHMSERKKKTVKIA